MNHTTYGEPYAGDSSFVAECRLLQSVYRVDIGQDIAPYVGRDGVHHYGNYISDGEVSGANFLEEYIFDYAKELKRATGDTVSELKEKYKALNERLTGNVSTHDRSGTDR